MSDVKLQKMVVEVEGIRETQILALLGGTICIGRVGVMHEGMLCAGIRQLFVEEVYRGSGVGSELVRACIVEAEASRCRAINLSIAGNNRRVFPFYHRLGFRLVCEYSDKEIVMSLPLGAGEKPHIPIA